MAAPRDYVCTDCYNSCEFCNEHIGKDEPQYHDEADGSTYHQECWEDKDKR